MACKLIVSTQTIIHEITTMVVHLLVHSWARPIGILGYQRYSHLEIRDEEILRYKEIEVYRYKDIEIQR